MHDAGVVSASFMIRPGRLLVCALLAEEALATTMSGHRERVSVTRRAQRVDIAVVRDWRADEAEAEGLCAMDGLACFDGERGKDGPSLARSPNQG